MDLKTDLKFAYSAAIDMNRRNSLLKMAVFTKMSKEILCCQSTVFCCEMLLPPEGATVSCSRLPPRFLHFDTLRVT